MRFFCGRTARGDERGSGSWVPAEASDHGEANSVMMKEEEVVYQRASMVGGRFTESISMRIGMSLYFIPVGVSTGSCVALGDGRL